MWEGRKRGVQKLDEHTAPDRGRKLYVRHANKKTVEGAVLRERGVNSRRKKESKQLLEKA